MNILVLEKRQDLVIDPLDNLVRLWANWVQASGQQVSREGGAIREPTNTSHNLWEGDRPGLSMNPAY